MASNQTLTMADRNAAIDAFTAAIAGGSIEFYDGAQPADPSVAITTQTKLVTFTMGSPAAAAAANGAAMLTAMAPATPIATGTVAWFRAKKADGTAVRDGTVGTAGADLTVDTTSVDTTIPILLSGSITIGATV